MTDQPQWRILFVCMGNICRSPTAEGVATNILENSRMLRDVYVDSAGTHSYHVGAAPDERAQEAAQRRGIDLSGLRARAVEPGDLVNFDLVLAMDQSNFDRLQAMAAEYGGHARIQRLLDYAEGGEVPDPYFGPGDGFERVLDTIEAGCRGLVDYLEANGLTRA